MDPYIEDPEVWSDFHNDLAGQVRAVLNLQIQPRYVARIIPRVTYDDSEQEKAQNVRPDVGVWKKAGEEQTVYQTGALLAPLPVESRVEWTDALRYASIEIVRAGTLELVTAVEILSPVNKRRGHRDFELYLRKRRDILRSDAHLIEIDLLRGGTRPPLQRAVPDAPYYITLSRVEMRPRVMVWPIQLNQKLPTFTVPLLEPDPDAKLDLGAVVTEIYERGGYATIIDYKQAPPPPRLSESESQYVDSLLKPLRENV